MESPTFALDRRIAPKPADMRRCTGKHGRLGVARRSRCPLAARQEKYENGAGSYEPLSTATSSRSSRATQSFEVSFDITVAWPTMGDETLNEIALLGPIRNKTRKIVPAVSIDDDALDTRTQRRQHARKHRHVRVIGDGPRVR